jgi:hypothetical protein
MQEQVFRAPKTVRSYSNVEFPGRTLIIGGTPEKRTTCETSVVLPRSEYHTPAHQPPSTMDRLFRFNP